VEDVEDLEHDRMAVQVASGEAVAQPREVGAPVVAEAHELAVEDRVPLAERVTDLRHFREILGALAAVARPQCYGAPVVAQLRATAIPFQLERPCLALGHPGWGQQHRRDEGRQRLAHDQAA
jgi:hypothetical protein